MIPNHIAELLNAKAEHYNQPRFMLLDPVQIPHRFSKLQDIEIMGFWAAVLAWGQRATIINKCTALIDRMDGAPHQFVTQHQDTDLKRFLDFKHRTFNATDALYFIAFFKDYYAQNHSLETAFIDPAAADESTNVRGGLEAFQKRFFGLDFAPDRTRKHVATPLRGSSCKRLNMFLRWMVRHDDRGVDFGLWRRISPAQLVCPCDVHVDRVARKLGLIQRPKTDWQTAVELTQNLKELDPLDPVKYDFALFGLGVEGEM